MMAVLRWEILTFGCDIVFSHMPVAMSVEGKDISADA
jgi:hypothetical protein